MRAARAANSRGEDGENKALGGSSRYSYTKARSRGSSLDRQSSRSMKSPPLNNSSRSRLLLPPDRHASISRRYRIPPTTKQQSVPKGSATKRSRVVGRVAAARGQVHQQPDTDSRYPVPYAEAYRDRLQPRALPTARARQDHQYSHYNNHDFGERVPFEQTGAGYTEPRTMLGIGSTERSHGPVLASSRRRTRPRSAMVAPSLSRSGSGPGNVNRQYQHVSQLTRMQKTSKALMGEERDRGGGSRRPRYKQSRRGGVSLFEEHVADRQSFAGNRQKGVYLVLTVQCYEAR